MSYQNLKTPRFYVDNTQWLNKIGAQKVHCAKAIDETEGIYEEQENSFLPAPLTEAMQLLYDDLGSNQTERENNIKKIINLNPSSIVKFPSFDGDDNPRWIPFLFPHLNSLPINDDNTTNSYVALLGHNLAEVGMNYCYTYYSDNLGNTSSLHGGISNIVNNSQAMNMNGFNIFTINDSNISNEQWSIIVLQNHILDGEPNTITGVPQIGCVSTGSYYDMPNSANLDLVFSEQYSPSKEILTSEGISISNTLWSDAPKWGSLNAWELQYPGNSNPLPINRSGRRAWSLTFNHLADSDVFGSNQSLNDILYTESLYDSSDIDNGNFKRNILTDNNFFSQVWRKTLGNVLPFIFQPDNSNSNPDQFAICKFEEDSLKVSQLSHNTYKISLKIVEAW